VPESQPAFERFVALARMPWQPWWRVACGSWLALAARRRLTFAQSGPSASRTSRPTCSTTGRRSPRRTRS